MAAPPRHPPRPGQPVSPTLALVNQILAEGYLGDDVVSLCRIVYVRVLFRIAKAGGGHRASGQMARELTARVLTGLLGYHFDANEVQALLDEEEGGTKEEDNKEPEKPMSAKDPRRI